jgi:hypothetical protein
MNDDIQTIVEIVVLLFFVGLMFIPFLLFFVYVFLLGKCPFPNGAVSVFCFDMRGEKHYFTSETGVFVFGSHKSTKAAFDESQRSFATSGVQVA